MPCKIPQQEGAFSVGWRGRAGLNSDFQLQSDFPRSRPMHRCGWLPRRKQQLERLPCLAYRGTSPIRKHPPHWDPPRTQGTGLRQGLRGLRFLMSEVPVYGPQKGPNVGFLYPKDPPMTY
jgi:hypothetical protein